ncbi:MAG: two pore domain potassium channel family protein [Solirubrobacteraceae bacterium]|nr:two pore domain potassium channel family protein [Solirubrobacteraceae bacterium]
MTSSEGTTRQRYALVMLLSLAAVLVAVAVPDTQDTRAIMLAIQGLALIVAIVAARDHERLRRGTAIALGVVLLVCCVLSGFGVITGDVRVPFALAIALATPLVMIRGLVRLLRERGVVLQAVFGALAIYLQVGLIFAFCAAGIGAIEGTPFFGGSDASNINDFVYFSFTTMSTTGYGDYTAATDAGRSLAVLEMLIGQIYLVTVVGLLIGNIGRQRVKDAETT